MVDPSGSMAELKNRLEAEGEAELTFDSSSVEDAEPLSRAVDVKYQRLSG